MNREQVAAFIVALNAAQPYVPPIIFQSITGNPLCKTLEAIAGGVIEFQPKPSSAPVDLAETLLPGT